MSREICQLEEGHNLFQLEFILFRLNNLRLTIPLKAYYFLSKTEYRLGSKYPTPIQVIPEVVAFNTRETPYTGHAARENFEESTYSDYWGFTDFYWYLFFHIMLDRPRFKCYVKRNYTYAEDFVGLCNHIYSCNVIYFFTIKHFVSQFLSKHNLTKCRLNAVMLKFMHGIICLQIEIKNDHYQSQRCTRCVKIQFCAVLVVAKTTAVNININSNLYSQNWWKNYDNVFFTFSDSHFR